MLRIGKVYLFLVLLPAVCIAQKPELKFDNITVKDGLSHNNIYSIIQDNEGFIWIGTQDGLNRYDGYKFVIYRHEPSNLNSLASNNFGKMYQDTSGIIWLGTYGGGLDRFNPLTNTFKHYKHNELDENTISSDRIQFIHEDRYGLFWIGTSGGGLNMFDRNTEKFVRFKHDPDNDKSLSHDRAKCIVEDEEGNLWIGTGKGLNLLDRKTGNFTRFKHNPDDPQSISHNHIQSMILDHEGIIWLGGRGGGLNRFDPKTRQFKNYKHNPNDPNSLSDDYVEIIFEDSNHNLWIGTYSGGLNLFDREKQQFYNYIFEPYNPFSLAHNRVEFFFEDRAKVLWIGTRGGGISKLDLKQKKFLNIAYSSTSDDILPHPSVYCINGDENGNLWLGTDGNGLLKYNPQTNTREYFNADEKKLKLRSNRIWAIHIDSRGIIWAGTYDGGLNRIIQSDDGKYQITGISPERDNPNSLAGKQINVIFEDKEGQIWIGTKRGLNKLKSSPFANNLEFETHVHDINNANSLSDNYISTIYQDSFGYLWIGTYVSGLNQMDIETGDIKRFYYNSEDSNSISDNRIQTIFEDSQTNLWIGTEGAGLNKFDRKAQGFIRIKQDETYSNVIMGIVEDRNNNLWISTSGGITRFNIQHEQFDKKYDITDGLISHGFNRNSAFVDHQGVIYFGSISGVTYFNPKEVKDNPFVPPILFTDFRILNKQLKDIDVNRYRLFREKRKVYLDHSENVFHIEFAAADYSSVSKNAFQYRLKGFENDWQMASNQRTVTYTNLYPGEYIFTVKGSNNDGIWNEKGASLSIIVDPPFYLTTWFILAVIFSIIGLIYIIITFRIRRLDKARRILEKKVEERTHEINKQKEELNKAYEEVKESARLKQMFLANTSHEIRTPLNVIVGFANLLMNSPLDLKQKDYISNIKNSSNNLLVLINDILDFSKIEANKLSLESIKFDIRNTIKTILNPLTIKAEEKQLSVSYEIDEDIPQNVIGDPARLNQIIVNLVGNSIKFTNQGWIKLYIRLEDKQDEKVILRFNVQDTGIGIAKDKQAKIFDSFSQGSTDTSRLYGGTGLGLSIVKKLVDIHQGYIRVDSDADGHKKNPGSTFEFTLHYKAAKSDKANKRAEEVKSKEDKQIEKMSILIVEDNKANQTLAVDTILMFNDKICIDIADNGKIALDKIEQNDYDLIVMDVQMPVMNGYETTEYIRTQLNGQKSKIPILGLSAHAMSKEKEKCIALGMNDYITKPFNPNVFYHKILHLVGIAEEKDAEEEDFVPETLLVKNIYKHINLVFLTKTYKGNFDKVRSILKLYLNNVPKQINDFYEDFENKNYKKLKTTAHSLKTTFKYLGVDALHKLFKSVELEAASEKLSHESKEKIIGLKEEWKKAKNEILDFIENDIQ